ncbi:MAG TPA: amino acid deaminase/aldolase [Marmoricola sp.]|nr:amino acid deaminase/aldolase [Marmoricola sp.]
MTALSDPAADPSARADLARRLDAVLRQIGEPATPLLVVDRDAFDANARELVARAGGKPIRVASKSVRVPALLERALASPGFSGVLSYNLREALWLVDRGISRDVVLGYPTVDKGALVRLATTPAALTAVTLMIDDAAHLDVIDAARRTPEVPVRVAIDIDAGLRVGGLHVGPKRSPLYDDDEVLDLVREVLRRPGFHLAGVMTYEGQVAGVPDDVPGQQARSWLVRRLKDRSLAQLAERRARLAERIGRLVELEFWNAGGSGSIEATSADAAVTELAAGSGLLVPGLFDHYQAFQPRPAAFFGVPVVRRPGPGTVTVAGGGFVASGAAGRDRLPVPWLPPGLSLTGLEGAGEVQTPLTGPAAARLRIGDWVWFRHAKAGELAEHGNQVHLVSGAAVVDTVPTYRGLGLAW